MEGRDLLIGDGSGNIAGTRRAACCQAGGGHLDTSGAADELQLNPGLVLIGVHCLGRHLVVLGVAVHEVVVESTGHGLRLLHQAVFHAAVIVGGNAHRYQRHQQHQQHQHRQNGIDDPPLPQAPEAQHRPFPIPFFLCHGPLLLSLRSLRRHHWPADFLRTPTCIRIPTPW